jgi:putative ABC transport system permease protein
MSNTGRTGADFFRDVVAESWRTIVGHRMRSLLLILGVAIGVMTILAIYTIVNGMSSRIRDDVVSANQPYLYVSRFSGLGGGDPEELMRRPQIQPDAIDALRQTEGVGLVDYQVSNGTGTVLKYGKEKTEFVQVFGASEAFTVIFSINMDDGRFLSPEDINTSSRICVLGYGPASDLFPQLDPVGRQIMVFGKSYRIVGTMESRDHFIGSMGDNFVCIPWTTFEKDGFKEGIEDRNVAVTVEEGYESDIVQSNVVGAMRQVRRLRPSQNNDFEVIGSDTYGEIIDKVTGGIALVLVVLSSIGLLVGGIGVMNIMLISVTERTKEIGVRMAIGARRKDVLLQILVEAGTLTGIGGLIGLGFGYLVSWGMTHLLRFPLQISPFVMIGTVLFSISIGLFFGLYPANKAARLDPIVALGRE